MAEKERGRGDQGTGQSERQERDWEVGWGEQEMKRKRRLKKKKKKEEANGEFETASREQGSERRSPWSKGEKERTFRLGLVGPPPGGPHIPHSGVLVTPPKLVAGRNTSGAASGSEPLWASRGPPAGRGGQKS